MGRAACILDNPGHSDPKAQQASGLQKTATEAQEARLDGWKKGRHLNHKCLQVGPLADRLG